MMNKGWYIRTKGAEKAHYFSGMKAQSECGDVELLVDAERWLATNQQHIGEVWQCVDCQASIARRDGRKPMEALDAADPPHPRRDEPRSKTRAERKDSTTKAPRRAR